MRPEWYLRGTLRQQILCTKNSTSPIIGVTKQLNGTLIQHLWDLSTKYRSHFEPIRKEYINTKVALREDYKVRLQRAN